MYLTTTPLDLKYLKCQTLRWSLLPKVHRLKTRLLRTRFPPQDIRSLQSLVQRPYILSASPFVNAWAAIRCYTHQPTMGRVPQTARKSAPSVAPRRPHASKAARRMSVRSIPDESNDNRVKPGPDGPRGPSEDAIESVTTTLRYEHLLTMLRL